MVQLVEHAPQLRLKPPCFCRSELCRDDELSEAREGRSDVLEAVLEHHGGGRACGVRSRGGPRSSQQLTPLGLSTDAVGGDEPQRLPVAEAVALDGGQQDVLLCGR